MKTLEIILMFLEYFFKEWHYEQAQKERDALSDDPYDWFVHHFDGVYHRPSPPNETEHQV